MILIIEKTNNGFLVETKTEGKFVFERFYQLYDFLTARLDPPEPVKVPAPKKPTPPIAEEDIPF